MQQSLRITEEEKLDSLICEDYITETQEWRKTQMYRWGYDANGFSILYSCFLRNNENTAWNNWRKEEYVRDDYGKLIQILLYIWNSDESVWNPNQKVLYEYNPAGVLISFSNYSWNDEQNDWMIEWKGDFSINQDGLATDDIFYSWDASQELWINDYKDEYSYDEDGNMTESIGYSWVKDSSIWNPETWIVYVWSENGNNTLITGYDWNEFDQVWNVDNKIEYEYDPSGNQVMRIYYTRNGEVWVPNDKWETTYTQGVKDRVVRHSWDNDAGEWVYNSRQIYYPHGPVVGLPDVSENPDLIFFPNPTQDYIYLKESDRAALLIIYDLQGKPVLSHKLNGSEQVDISQIPAGTYVLKILDNNKLVIGKMVIER